MFVLYRMTEAGPHKEAHWPVGIEESYAPEYFISADDTYIFCLSLDAQSIEVHDATTVSSLPNSFSNRYGYTSKRHVAR